MRWGVVEGAVDGREHAIEIVEDIVPCSISRPSPLEGEGREGGRFGGCVSGGNIALPQPPTLTSPSRGEGRSAQISFTSSCSGSATEDAPSSRAQSREALGRFSPAAFSQAGDALFKYFFNAERDPQAGSGKIDQRQFRMTAID